MNITSSPMVSTSQIHTVSSPRSTSHEQQTLNKTPVADDQQKTNQLGDSYEKITLSEAGRKRSIENTVQSPVSEQQKPKEKSGDNKTELNSEDLRTIQKMQMRDREVRAHEQAHLANAGQYARGGASFTYTAGPDGKRYASGGEVPIDTSGEKTPEKTIQKMQAIRRAALAPASPSGADRNIAASASKKEAAARSELQEKMASKTQSGDEKKDLAESENAVAATNQNKRQKTGPTTEIGTFKTQKTR